MEMREGDAGRVCVDTDVGEHLRGLCRKMCKSRPIDVPFPVMEQFQKSVST